MQGQKKRKIDPADYDAVVRERDEANRQAALAFQAGIHHQERANTAEREREQRELERDAWKVTAAEYKAEIDRVTTERDATLGRLKDLTDALSTANTERDRYARALRAVIAHLTIGEPIIAWTAADNALERPKLFDTMKFEGETGGEL